LVVACTPLLGQKGLHAMAYSWSLAACPQSTSSCQKRHVAPTPFLRLVVFLRLESLWQTMQQDGSPIADK
jgi:hypothetical protein